MGHSTTPICANIKPEYATMTQLYCKACSCTLCLHALIAKLCVVCTYKHIYATMTIMCCG